MLLTVAAFDGDAVGAFDGDAVGAGVALGGAAL